MSRTAKLLRRAVRWAARRLGQAFEVFHAIGRDYAAKRLSITAAGLAYYVFLGFFPFVLVILAAVGYLLGSSDAHYRAVEQAVTRALPVANLRIEKQLDTIVAHRAVVGGLGLLALVWSASNAFTIFIQALRVVWEVKARPKFVLIRLGGLALLALAVVFLVLSVVASSAMPLIARVPVAGVVLRWGELPAVWRLGSTALSLAQRAKARCSAPSSIRPSTALERPRCSQRSGSCSRGRATTLRSSPLSRP